MTTQEEGIVWAVVSLGTRAIGVVAKVAYADQPTLPCRYGDLVNTFAY